MSIRTLCSFKNAELKKIYLDLFLIKIAKRRRSKPLVVTICRIDDAKEYYYTVISDDQSTASIVYLNCQIDSDSQPVNCQILIKFVMDLVDKDKYVTIITKPPTYIKALTKCDDNIILVHSAVNRSDYVDDSLIKLSQSASDISTNEMMLDITGSPLKYSFDNSAIMHLSILECQQNLWLKAEEKHYPLTVEEARKFIQDYFRCNKNKTKAVWCVCDGKDEKKTVLLSGYQKYGQITSTIVTIDGYEPTSDQVEKMRQIMDKHCTLVPTNSVRQKKSIAQHHISGLRITEENVNDKSSGKGSVFLEVTSNYTDGAESMMMVQAIVGHPDAASFPLWQNLVLLELYVNTLKQYECQEMQYSDWLPTISNANTVDDPIDLIVKIVQNPSHRSRVSKKDVSNLNKIVEDVEYRNSIDVTDLLWNVLINCSTYGKLLDCLNAFLTEVAYNKNKVYIAESNNCVMAELLRGVLDGKMAVPTFTGTQPIEILIEIGIEKLRKDYVHVCKFGNITDVKQIYDLFRMKSNSTNETKRPLLIMPKCRIINLDDAEHSMKILGQLETLIEILLLVPSDWLSYTVESAYKYFLGKNSPITNFKTLADNKFYELVVKLPTNLVQEHIVSREPVSRYHYVFSESSWKSVKSVLYQSLQPLIPYSIYKFDPVLDTSTSVTEINDVRYHYLNMWEITNYFKEPKENAK